MKAYYDSEPFLENVTAADTFSSRLLGLMGRRSLGPSEGLLLFRCARIHCLFMRFPIDAVYLTEDMRVLQIETLPPWRLGKRVPQTKHILELAAGVAKGRLSIGARIRFEAPAQSLR